MHAKGDSLFRKKFVKMTGNARGAIITVDRDERNRIRKVKKREKSPRAGISAISAGGVVPIVR